MAWPLYAKQSVEFYCGCRYNGNQVDLRSCGSVSYTHLTLPTKRIV